jgi:hypothetical protein
MSAFVESRLESKVAAKIGGVLYVVWGVLHLIAAWGIHVLAASVPSGLTYGRLEQAAWNLAVFALLAMVLGVALNWKNDKIGYWINLIVVGVVDLGFVIFVIVPGYVSASAASLAGPIVYLTAAIFSTMGLRLSRPLN